MRNDREVEMSYGSTFFQPCFAPRGFSGTLGCVGLIRSDEMVELASLIEQRNVRTLVVLE